ncbi:MAG: helix-hairpin-helix domain-containing protein [Coriobacteriales bacterium]
MLTDDLKLKLACLLRRAGLSRVPRSALLCMGVGLALLGGLAMWRFWPAGEPQVPGEADFQVLAQEEQEPEEALIVVDVEGAVRNPGLYTLPAGARAGDAVEAAGGLAPKALQGGVNLAQELEDGQQLNIPFKGSASKPAAGAGTAGGAGASGSAGSGLVNINTASAQELQQLSGIGPALSQRIVDYRAEHGPFASIEDLLEVSGIGQAIVEKIRSQVSVGT